jgi:hypothetical protein
MRGPILFGLLGVFVAATGGCTKETPNPDAPSGNHPPPRVIAGGGIGDGAIDGVVNLYVIDDRTRAPIPGATVRIGATDGVTDATGLFVADGAVGPQTVIAKATGYRSELWIGANGANLTIDLQAAVAPAAGHADLSGQITGFAGLTVPAGHAKVATVVYSQSDDLGDAANNLKTAGDANNCAAVAAGAGCTFTVTARTGHVGLIAAIYDYDGKGTADPADDTSTLIAWAYRSGITVADGVNQTAQDLALIAPGSVGQATIDFGAPPSTLSSVAALIGIDTPGDGVYQLPAFRTPASTTMMVPALPTLGATGYRLTGIAQTAAGDAGTQSIVLRRGLTGTTLAAGTWLTPPQTVTLTRTAASWSAIPGVTVTGVELTQGSSTLTHLLDITVFDGSTSVTIPPQLAFPATGVLDAKLSAISATGLDVTSFGLDADRTKLDRVASQPVTIAN